MKQHSDTPRRHCQTLKISHSTRTRLVVRRLPEVQLGEQRRGRLLQQARQLPCAVKAKSFCEAAFITELHVARALGSRPAHHLHAPIRVHLIRTERGTSGISARKGGKGQQSKETTNGRGGPEV